MAEFPSLPLWTDAYLSDTRHLSTTEHGAYLLLLMTAWRTPDCSLPDDDKMLARWAGLDGRRWSQIKPQVMAMWTLEGNCWTQKRLSKEASWVRKNAEAKRASGSAGGRAKALKEQEAALAALQIRHGETVAPTPTPIIEKEDNPNGLSKKDRRGSRLPDDWEPDELPLSIHPPPGLVEAEADKFRDYWTAQPGQKGVKLDWQATWRNWMRKAMEQNNAQRMGTGNGSSSQPQPQYRAQPGWELFKSLRGRGDTGELDDDGSSGLRSRGVLSPLEMPGQD
jgi:uncharacterized protein YdaU (DUF1376 family)